MLAILFDNWRGFQYRMSYLVMSLFGSGIICRKNLIPVLLLGGSRNIFDTCCLQPWRHRLFLHQCTGKSFCGLHRQVMQHYGVWETFYNPGRSDTKFCFPWKECGWTLSLSLFVGHYNNFLRKPYFDVKNGVLVAHVWSMTIRADKTLYQSRFILFTCLQHAASEFTKVHCKNKLLGDKIFKFLWTDR